MNIGICDDDKQTRKQLSDLCQNLGYNKVYEFKSGEELLNSDICSKLTLVFLDIEMSGMTGIDVKNKMEKSCPFTLIIFNTSHNEKVNDAFGRNVISFISKPFSEISIRHNIEKAAFLCRNFLPIKIDNNTSIPCEDILYLCSEQKYSIFHTKNGNSILSRKPLKNWANLKHYKKIENKKIILYNGASFPISRRYTNLVQKRFDQYILDMMRAR